jgi:hypothetical protein
MNISKLGFCGCYGFKFLSSDTPAQILTKEMNEVTDDNSKKLVTAIQNGNNVGVITDNPQWSKKDYELLDRGISRAQKQHVIDNGNLDNPFNAGGRIRTDLDNAFITASMRIGQISPSI